MRKVLYAAVGWLIGGGLGWLALHGIDWGEASSGLRQVDWVVALGVVLAVGLAHYLKAVRWRLLLQDQPISSGRLFHVQLTGAGVNTVSPVRMVGESVQMALLTQRNGIASSRVAASMIMSHLFDLVVSLNIIALGLLLLPQLADYRPLALGLGGLFLVILLAAPRLAGLTGRIPLTRRNGFVRETLRALHTSGWPVRTHVTCAALTAGAWGLLGVAGWLVASAVGVGLPFLSVAVVVVLAVRFSGLLLPPGVVGVFELILVSSLGLLGVEPAVALSFALAVHVLLYGPPVLVAAATVLLERGALASAFLSLTRPLRGAGAQA